MYSSKKFISFIYDKIFINHTVHVKIGSSQVACSFWLLMILGSNSTFWIRMELNYEKNWTSKSDTAHLYHGFLWVSKYLFFRFSPYKSLSFLNNFDQNEETKSIVLSFALSNKCQPVEPEERIPIIPSKKRQKVFPVHS